MIWPARQLAFNRRYIVAVRGLVTANGLAVPPSAAFRALRDGEPSDDPAIENRRALFADIFAVLAAAGIAQPSLQLAWDFSTASLEATTGWLVAMRDDAAARIPPGGPEYRINAVVDDYNPQYARPSHKGGSGGERPHREAPAQGSARAGERTRRGAPAQGSDLAGERSRRGAPTQGSAGTRTGRNTERSPWALGAATLGCTGSSRAT